jgi:transcription-repair coupling factor (superfamily II helicase)
MILITMVVRLSVMLMAFPKVHVHAFTLLHRSHNDAIISSNSWRSFGENTRIKQDSTAKPGLLQHMPMPLFMSSVDDNNNNNNNIEESNSDIGSATAGTSLSSLSSLEADDRRKNRERFALIQQMLAADEAEWEQEQQQRKFQEEQSDIAQRLEAQQIMAQLASDVGVTLTSLENPNPLPAKSADDRPTLSTSALAKAKALAMANVKQLEPMPLPTYADDSTGTPSSRKGKGKSVNGDDNGQGTTAAEIYANTAKAERGLTNSKKMEEFKKKKSEEMGSDDNDSNGGTFVGSAGGWSLEIFPGDFVVHRKYGIGKFERTVVVDKILDFESDEYYNQQRRREALVKAAKSAKWAATKIEKLVSAFGTERDNDLVSRPRATMLELSYADGLVHVPIDKAYRLSRYRAGDAAIKPKLTRLRGDHTWRKAKERVAQSTTELAQDVLALYATRETLSRYPYDPKLEPDIKEFGNSFPYQPTPDQFTCFEDIENDMVWRRRPMDRLVCGDVGFGKTEGELC